MKKKVYLAVRIIDGKAEVDEISAAAYNDYGWRLRMQEKAQNGNFSIYFTEAEINIEQTSK